MALMKVSMITGSSKSLFSIKEKYDDAVYVYTGAQVWQQSQSFLSQRAFLDYSVGPPRLNTHTGCKRLQ